MDNIDKLATYGTQDEEQNKFTRQYVLDMIIRERTHMT